MPADSLQTNPRMNILMTGELPLSSLSVPTTEPSSPMAKAVEHAGPPGSVPRSRTLESRMDQSPAFESGESGQRSCRFTAKSPALLMGRSAGITPSGIHSK